MKKELLLAVTPITEPATENIGIGTISSRTALHARQFRLIFSVLLILIVTKSTSQTNHNLSAAISPSPQSQAVTTYGDYLMAGYTNLTDINIPLRPITKNNGKSLDDVTVVINNYFYRDFDVWLNNQDTSYYLNIHPNQTDVHLIVPEGTYDIIIAPNDNESGTHHYMVGCGHYGIGKSSYAFWGIPISSTCNGIDIDF